MYELATLGGGCFWCIEAALGQLNGVESAISGYAGGHRDHPDYRSVCTGTTGHAEVVQFKFDPAKIDYRTLLYAFFTAHDPTTLNRQGNDVGPQYRSVIFTHSPEQDRIAREVIAQFMTEQVWPEPIVTEVTPLGKFWPAEIDHQEYFGRNPDQPYCAYVVAPKVAKVRERFRHLLKSGSPP